MRVHVCFIFNEVECNSDEADSIIENMTDECETMRDAFGASDCYIMDADDNDLPLDEGE